MPAPTWQPAAACNSSSRASVAIFYLNLHGFRVDLCGATGNEEMADTSDVKLGWATPCTWMERHHHQQGNSMSIICNTKEEASRGAV